MSCVPVVVIDPAIPSFHQEKYQFQIRFILRSPGQLLLPLISLIPEAAIRCAFHETPLKTPHATAAADSAAECGKSVIQDLGEDTGQPLSSSIEGDHGDSQVIASEGMAERGRLSVDRRPQESDLDGCRDLVAFDMLSGFEGEF